MRPWSPTNRSRWAQTRPSSTGGNVNLTPGIVQIPGGLASDTNLAGGTGAQGYVTGLLSIPSASASANFTSNAALTIDPEATIGSGQDTIIGAYPGTPSPTADGTGHASEVGFIPVKGGSSKATPHATSTVMQDGAITAGSYHQLTVTIPNDGSAGAPSVRGSSSVRAAPTSYSYDSLFSPTDFIASTFSDPQEQQAFDSGVAPAGTTVQAVILDPLFASGGVVTINADTLQGNGSITAYGTASITVDNESGDYLILQSVSIPSTATGAVVYSGKAQQPGAMTISTPARGWTRRSPSTRPTTGPWRAP